MGGLERIRIVLVKTSDSGNIGAAARAIKTMGLGKLLLVSPKEYPSAKATARASGAADLLHHAVVVNTLDEAISDCALVLGTSARLRSIPWPVVNPRQCAELVATEKDNGGDIAIIFGQEDRGLSNEELRKCHYHISIPGNPEYGVLNLASAVQVICYELRMRLVESACSPEPDADDMPLSLTKWDTELVGAREMELFLAHFEETMRDIEFFDPDNPRQLLTRARRIFMRTRLDRLEVNLLRGFFGSVQKLNKELKGRGS